MKSLTGGSANEVVAYTTGTVPQLYMMKQTMMRLVWRDLDTIPSTVDTIYAMDVSLLGSIKKDPVQVVQKDFHYNFYLPHCPPGGVEFVEGYHRSVYPGVYEGIDMHIYSGSLGMKLAFVIHPGADPTDLRLKFSGLDSLRYDILGSIRAMLKDKYIRLPEAVAYQLDANDNIIPVGWTADYQIEPDSSVAGFICPAYDEQKPLVLQIGLPPLGGEANVDGVCWSTYWNGEDKSTPNDVVFVPGGVDEENNAVADAEYYTGRSFAEFLSFPPFIGELYAPSNPASTIYVSRFEDTRPRWTNYHGISAGTHDVQALTPCANFGVAIGGSTLQGAGMEEFGPPGSFLGTGAAAGYLARFEHDGELTWCTRYHKVSDMAYDAGLMVVVGQVSTPGPFYTPANQPAGAAWFPGVPQVSGQSAGDAYIAVFDDLNQLRWSTRVGGEYGEDHARVAIHQGRIAMAGLTSSPDFPAILDGGPLAYDQSQIVPDSYPGDMFLLRFDESFALEWGTFVGGPGANELPTFNKGLAIKPVSGNVMLLSTGTAQSIPYLPGTYWSTPPPPAGIGAGMLMEFDGNTNQLLYSTFLNGGQASSFWPSCIAVSQYDDVYIGGMIKNTATFNATESPGLYFDPIGFGVHDGFILWLSTSRSLKWYTRFGGASGSTLEEVRSLAVGKGTLYATGVTRADFSQGQFFPLVDPGPPAYFSPIGDQQNSTFITSFCQLQPTVGVTEQVDERSLSISTTMDRMVLAEGLEEDVYPYAFHDAQGREVARGQVRANGGKALIPLPEVVPAIYVLRIAGHAAQVIQLPNR